jgi:hypothetical protein
VTFEVARRAFEDDRLIERLDPRELDEDRMILTGLAGDVMLRRAWPPHPHHLGEEGDPT